MVLDEQTPNPRMNLLVVIPYHKGDAAIAADLLTLIEQYNQIRPCENHSCLLVADAGVDPDMQKKIFGLARSAFPRPGTIGSIPVAPSQGHAPTQVFLAACRWIKECCRLPFLWMEPDCIPLVPGWLHLLAEEYEQCPFRFLGPIIDQDDQAGLPKRHLTGCAIYPNDANDVYANIPALQTDNVAWDMAAADAVLPRAKNSRLMRHFWGTREMPPVFVETRQADSPKNFVTLDFAFQGGSPVTFHRSKDGKLIELLRRRYKLPGKPSDVTVAQVTVTSPAPEKLEAALVS